MLLLLLFAVFLATTSLDNCHDEQGSHGQQSSHVLCVDDCAPALLPHAPVPPPPDALPRPIYEATMVRPILNLELEPEKAPPRA